MFAREAKKRDFEYFHAFLTRKIDEGVKQIDISNYINKKAPYISKIYLNNQKSCPLKIQEKIAEYFNLTYSELLEMGKKYASNSEYDELDTSWNEKQKMGFIERRSLDPNDLIEQLRTVIGGIRTCGKKIEKYENSRHEIKKLKDTIAIHLEIFSELHEGVSYFNTKRELIFSSNRWGLLDQFDITQVQSIDSMLLFLRQHIINFEEVVDMLNESYAKTTKATIPVKLKGNKNYIFQVIPINIEKKHSGWLLINTPAP